MQVVFVDGDEQWELDLSINNPAATVADLIHALAPSTPPDHVLLVGDHPADPDFELSESGLYEGAELRIAPPTSRGVRYEQPVAPVPFGVDADLDNELVTVNGLDAGRRVRIDPGTLTVGRAPGCDFVLRDHTVSSRHATLTRAADGETLVNDLDSHNGTWVDGEPLLEGEHVPYEEGQRLVMGALSLEVRPAKASDRSLAVDPLRHGNTAGTIPFNRPPRSALPSGPGEIKAPKPADEKKSKAPLSLISILVPIVFAGVMVKVTGHPQFALFALMSPVMMIGNAIDAKRRGKKTVKGERERFKRELKEFRVKLAQVVDEERRHRHTIYPDPAEIQRRVHLPSTALWERRPADPDFLQLRGGVGDVPWQPPVTEVPKPTEMPEELQKALADGAILRSSPVPVDLSNGGVVGIVGERAPALALARSLLCQASTLHGPADLPIMILASAAAAPEWDWAKWLPHTRDTSGSRRMLSDRPELSGAMVESVLREAEDNNRQKRQFGGSNPPAGPTRLVVVDDESLTEGRKAPTRSLLRGEAGPVAGVVVASRAERLPAMCTTVVEMTGLDGEANLTLPQLGVRVEQMVAAGMATDMARDCACQMARFEDPELDIAGAGLPASIRLLPLLDLEECSAEGLLARWKAGGVDPEPAGPIGVSEDGVFSINFVIDGPHGLVGGTTGAGKSELLRSMVAGLAATVDPDHLTFVLVDFKGGSAFDECAKLPHTVGMVTDLDEHLAERALRCLEAELKHRERVLRDAGATDLPDYLRNAKGTEAMPRLIVIIDEFASLKAELPEFMDALVGVAQRGRSLGVHMLLATQRPQGAISENIRANTNLRIALRVQDRTDSTDVIDVDDAAAIPRTSPGRAYVRLGPSEVVAIQSALSTGSRSSGAQAHVEVAPFVYGPEPRRPSQRSDANDEAEDADTDLSVLVRAINDAFARTGRPMPRRPWPEPLAGDVDLDQVIDEAHGRATKDNELDFVPLALADDPEAQDQYPVGWSPSDGNLIVYGVGGAGTTTTLTSLGLALARLNSPDDLHLYGLDFGAAELADLAPLPHVGAVVQASERERQARLIRNLRAELDRRREMGASAVRAQPTIVTLIDGWSAFYAEYHDMPGNLVLEQFTRVFADGPEVKLYTVISADRAGAISSTLASLVQQRWAQRLADPYDYSNFGIRRQAVPEMVPGRALAAGSGQEMQIARPWEGVAAAASKLADKTAAPTRPPTRIETLPATIPLGQVDEAAQLTQRPWFIPIAVAEATLAPVGLQIYQGEHALIAGPARSGKSTALLTVATKCKQAQPDLTMVLVAGPRSPLSEAPLFDQVVHPSTIGETLTPMVDAVKGPVLVAIDDAEAIDDTSDKVLEKLSTSDRADLLVVAAGRNDGVRAGYSHWTRPLRRAKLGVLLQPDIDMDGDLLGTRVPRRAPVAMTVGRGYVVNSGACELAQLGLP